MVKGQCPGLLHLLAKELITARLHDKLVFRRLRPRLHLVVTYSKAQIGVAQCLLVPQMDSV